jgi:hypothetical protein
MFWQFGIILWMFLILIVCIGVKKDYYEREKEEMLLRKAPLRTPARDRMARRGYHYARRRGG